MTEANATNPKVGDTVALYGLKGIVNGSTAEVLEVVAGWLRVRVRRTGEYLQVQARYARPAPSPDQPTP